MEKSKENKEPKVTSENYVENVLRTEPADYTPVMERLQNLETVRLLHAVMGMVTEAGELATELKKFIFYGKALDKVNLQEEVGDSLWYAGLATDIMKTTMDDIMSGNIEKLKKRYPDKFSESHALNRDKDRELDHFFKD